MFKLKEKIKSMKCMEGILFYRRYKIDSNLKKILKSYDNQNIVLFEERRGDLNKDKSIYHIKIDDAKWRFFCMLVVGIARIIFCR